jgi:hypothetical protein
MSAVPGASVAGGTWRRVNARWLEEKVKFGRIQQWMEGHQPVPRRVLIERTQRA